MNMPKRASCHHRSRSAWEAASVDALLGGDAAAIGPSAAREPAAHAVIPPRKPSCFKNERRSARLSSSISVLRRLGGPLQEYQPWPKEAWPVQQSCMTNFS